MRYSIGTQIGDKGGFGAVYRCTSEKGGNYAIKFLENTDDESIERFRKEIRLLKTLSHPNIIKIFGSNVDGERKCYVMPLYSSSLNAIIPDLYNNFERQYAVISEIVNGVMYLHSEGVLHRDLKPQNILYNSDSDIVITDFGFCRKVDSASERLTQLGEAFGTRGYSAPEQFDDAGCADERSDIFSLGRIIEDITTNLHEYPIPTSDLHYIISKCTQTAPERRFSSVVELKAAIDSVYQTMLGLIEQNTIDDVLAKMKLKTADSNDVHELAVKMLTNDNGEKLEEYFHSISDELYQELESRDSELVEKLITQLQQYYTCQGWSFGYTDTIGSNCKRLFTISENAAVKANLLYAIIEVGLSHNRWYVMGIAAELLKTAKDEVAICLELAGILAHCNIDLHDLNINKSDLATCLHRYYKQ